MARFSLTVNEKRSMGAARAQPQEQEQQQQREEQQQQQEEQQRQQVHSESDNNTGLRCPMLPPVLALPAFQPRNWSGNGVTRYATCEDNRAELQEERNRLIQRYAGGELQFLIDWFEHIHRDLEEIRRELDSVEEELSRKPSA